VTTDLIAAGAGGGAPAGGTASFTGLQRPPKSFLIVQELGECVAAALAETTAGPPDRVCLVVPGKIAWDKCECGQLALTVNRFYWARDATLGQTSDFGGASDCGLPYLVMDVTISITRCAPVGDIKNELAPSCQELLDAARSWHEDAQAVRVGAGCCLKAMEDDNDILAFAMVEQPAVGPEGGCVGSELRVLIGLPNCLCPAS